MPLECEGVGYHFLCDCFSSSSSWSPTAPFYDVLSLGELRLNTVSGILV